MPDDEVVPEPPWAILAALAHMELGRRYRDVRDAIAAHRTIQADAEVRHGRLARLLGPGHPDVVAAGDAVARARADVEWCVASTVASGELYKGLTLEEAIAGGLADPHNRPPRREHV